MKTIQIIAYLLIASVFYLAVVIGLGIMLTVLIRCSAVPTREFNAEDKQDGPCYATYGAMRGYCAAIEE